MFELNSRSYRLLTTSLIYFVAIAAALTIGINRSRANLRSTPQTENEVIENRAPGKPFFSLATRRTFGTNENARLWLEYQNVEQLDFRVYQVEDPVKLLTGLSDPHQFGEEAEKQFSSTLSRTPSVLERIRAAKRNVYTTFKSYLRTQLQPGARSRLPQKFRPEKKAQRIPLNVSDYARVPLLNPNRLVTSWREPLPAAEANYDQRAIPLGKFPSGVYLVEAVSGELRAYTIAVVTQMTLLNKTAHNGDLLVYASDRKTGEPRPGARVDVIRDSRSLASGTTDAQGILRTRIEKKLLSGEREDADPTEAGSSRSFVIMARQQNDFAISDLESFYFLGYQGEENEESVKGYIYSDRPVYRPAQKVFFKGILRSVDDSGGYKPISNQMVHVSVEDPNGSRVLDQELPISGRGTFNGELELNEEAPLGSYQIEAEIEEGTANGRFEVAEYKKPEYKVKVSPAQNFVPAGEKTSFSIDARYFFGAPVANAEVKYYLYRSHYYPWPATDEDESEEAGDEADEYTSDYGYGGDMIKEGDVKLDAQGHFQLEFETPPIDESEPYDFSYRLEAQVVDSARRSIFGSASFVATRGKVVATAQTDRYVYYKGDTAKIRVTTADYEGRPVSARVELKFVERTWTKIEKKEAGYSYPEYEMHERELGSALINTDNQGSAFYDYSITEPGNISIKTIVDENGKKIASVGGYLWVTDRQYSWSEASYYSANYASIKLVPDKKTYRAGETAHVLAIFPSDSPHLLVSTELTKVMAAWPVKVQGRAAILDVPIDASYAPNVFLNVSYVQDGEMYTAEKRLVVPARDKLLNIEILSNKQEYKPRETASYTVLARDADGTPVSGAEISLGVVDEAIYSISPDTAGNIRTEFYGMRYNSVETHYSVSYSFTGYAGEKPINLARNKPSYQLADFKNEEEPVEPMIRKLFKDTAFWQPNLITGADGRATVKVKLPDNLTTWRATARGVTTDTKVGATTYKVLARKDVIMRLETPRFTTQGDTLVLSGIVHNYLKKEKVTQISLSVQGAQLLSPASQTVSIPSEGEHRIDWKISASEAGEIKLLAKALTNTESDAVELPLEVVPRGLHQSQNQTWSSGDENTDQTFTVNLPANADAGARKLRIEISPSIAGTLFGALDYLTTYPYGCTEQTMSSFLPNVVVTRALQNIQGASIRKQNDLPRKVKKGMDRLYAFQHNDGGWGWWKDDQSDPFMTAYVIDGLWQAKQAGYQVDDARLTSAREKLRQMLLANRTEAGTLIDLETRSFMVYSLAISGDTDQKFIDNVFNERKALQPYGRGLLALTLKLAGRDREAREVADLIEGTAIAEGSGTHWESHRKPMLDFAETNDTEATAISLKALVRIKPESNHLAGAARWLVTKRRSAYYWNSTKDTAFAISGLIDYVKNSREFSPDYNLEVYLNGETVATQRVDRQSAMQSIVITRAGNSLPANNQIRVVKRGRGMIYFSTAINYYTNDEEVAAQGSPALELTREYYRLKVVEDGYKLRWVLEPLNGEIHSGDLLVVKLRLRGTKARHLMIEDPIPAGAEQIESVGYLNLGHDTANGWSDWYSGREFRDQRTVFFIDYFDGDVTLQYAMSVQVPGDFRIAPARAELMYQPEIQANTATGRMNFLDRR